MRLDHAWSIVNRVKSAQKRAKEHAFGPKKPPPWAIPGRLAPLRGTFLAAYLSCEAACSVKASLIRNLISRHLRKNATLHADIQPRTGGLSAHIARFHCKVCTSTESTAGRSCTIGAHESPESAEAYTWPPVVPK
jgi:hypothetical protein